MAAVDRRADLATGGGATPGDGPTGAGPTAGEPTGGEPALDQVALASVVRDRITASVAVKQALADDPGHAVTIAAELIGTFRRGGKLLLFGNGGSAADAQHIAAEFVGRFYMDRRALPALALNVNPSVMTALGNDFGFDEVFARQVEALGRSGDLAIGLSTSGNSENVVRGLRAARAAGMLTVGMTGANPGRVGEASDLCATVPSADTPRIQEAHILLGHVWSEIVEEALFR